MFFKTYKEILKFAMSSFSSFLLDYLLFSLLPGLRMTFGLRYGLTAAAGAATGTLLAAVCADGVVSMLLRNFGIGGFRSESGGVNVLIPAFVIMILAFIFAWFFARQIKTVSVTRLLQDE